MPATESQILTSFLLTPAPLPTSLPPSQFSHLFPTSIQSSPALAALYRDLQSQRNEDIALVRKNIETECQRGAKQIREMRRERRKRDVNGSVVKTTNLSAKQLPHTPTTLTPSLESAQKALEAEIAALEEETKEILENMKATVGDLSDLRYGRFQKTPGADTDLRDEVLEALSKVKESADSLRDKAK